MASGVNVEDVYSETVHISSTEVETRWYIIGADGRKYYIETKTKSTKKEK